MEDSITLKKSTLKKVGMAVVVLAIIGFAALIFLGSSETPVSSDIDDPVIGDPNAPVTIVEYSEFECPFCGAFMGTNQMALDYLKNNDPSYVAAYPEIKKNYVDTGKVKIIFKNFVVHDTAFKAAEASECANEQGKFEEYYETLFENYEALEVSDLKGYAKQLGLDTTQFDSCLDTGKYTEEVNNDIEDGTLAGVSGTPAFFINGELVAGAHPYSTFQQIIESMLAA